MARFNLVKIRFSKNTLIEWTCIQVGKNVSLLSVYCLQSDKMMFHIGTKNIVGDNIKILQLSPIWTYSTHGRDAVCVSGTEPRYVVPQ